MTMGIFRAPGFIVTIELTAWSRQSTGAAALRRR
jgi:hypothetical protein